MNRYGSFLNTNKSIDDGGSNALIASGLANIKLEALRTTAVEVHKKTNNNIATITDVIIEVEEQLAVLQLKISP